MLPDVAGVVLASGLSRRFGARNKLLVRVEGEPIVRRTVRAYLESGLAPVVVVLGYQADEVRGALAGLDVLTVPNPDFALGQSRALVRGIRALPDHVPAAVVGVGDQPWLRPGTVRRLVQVWAETGAAICAPRYAGQRGNPVLFARSLFPELAEVEGDVGGRPVIGRHEQEVVWVPVQDERQGRDVDTPDSLPAGGRDGAGSGVVDDQAIEHPDRHALNDDKGGEHDERSQE